MTTPGKYVRILGPVEILVEGTPISLSRRKQRLLLALLAVRANRPVSFTGIVNVLWPSGPPAKARNQIHVHISAIRAALAHGRTPDDSVETRPTGYVLNAPPVEVDLHRFEGAASGSERAASDGRLREAHRLARDALAQWSGPPLDGLDGWFAQSVTARLEERRLAVLERRLDLDLALGLHADALTELAGLVRSHPLHQGFRRRHILALYCSERPADALAACQTARRALAEELGIEAARGLDELELAILRGVPADRLVTGPAGG